MYRFGSSTKFVTSPFLTISLQTKTSSKFSTQIELHHQPKRLRPRPGSSMVALVSAKIRLEKANIQSAANAFSPFSYTMAVPRRDSLQASLPQPLQCDSHAVRPLSLQITMAAAQRQASQTTSMQHLQGDSHAAQTLVLQITMAPVHRHTSQTSFSQHLQCDSEPARTNTMEITMAVVHRHSVRTSWPQPLQCDSQPVATIALQITMAVTHRTAGGPAATTRAAAPSGASGYCACHCRERGGPSGDNARRSPFWRLWVLRLPLQRARGAQRRQRAPQPLLEALGTAPATAESEGGPAATTRAAAPSGGSGYCACHCRERGAQRRQRAPQPLLQSLDDRLWECEHAAQTLVLQITMAPVHRHTSQTSFSQHLQCDSEPARTNTMEITMAVVHRHSVRTSWPQPLQCDSQPVTTIALQITMAVTHRTAGGPAATTRAADPSGGSGYCTCHCRERGGPSGDNARRSPFWRLCVLRLPLQRARGAQRRQRAPQPLLEALGTAPATAESEGGPAATTRAAAPSEGSGYCACHCRERGGPSGDNARRSPFWRLWVLRLPLQRERGAQRRQRAPQPLLQSLDDRLWECE